MELETIDEKALMTRPLTFSLLCDQNSLFRAKRIVGFPYLYKRKERKKERKKEREREGGILPIVGSFEIFAAKATITRYHCEVVPLLLSKI